MKKIIMTVLLLLMIIDVNAGGDKITTNEFVCDTKCVLELQPTTPQTADFEENIDYIDISKLQPLTPKEANFNDTTDNITLP